MSNNKVIDITDLIKKRDGKKKEKESPDATEDFCGILLVEFDKKTCSFNLLFETPEQESLPLDGDKVWDTIERLSKL